MSLIDLTNTRVNKLRVLRRVENVGKQPAWLCRCDCGTEKAILGMHLRAGKPVDCGCEYLARQRAAHVRHGMTDSPEWKAWKSMLDRCLNDRHPSWKHYGGRGIKVCKRWRTFENFYADMGPRPAGYSLDRIDNSKGYSPANCRWATDHEQQNNRRSNVRLTLDGKTKTLKEWAAHFGVDYAVVKYRRAVGTPEEFWFSASPRKEYKRLIEFKGKAKTITQWAKHYRVPYQTVWQRLTLRKQNPDGSNKC